MINCLNFFPLYVFQEAVVLKQNFEIFQNTLLSDHEEVDIFRKLWNEKNLNMRKWKRMFKIDGKHRITL